MNSCKADDIFNHSDTLLKCDKQKVEQNLKVVYSALAVVYDFECDTAENVNIYDVTYRFPRGERKRDGLVTVVHQRSTHDERVIRPQCRRCNMSAAKCN